MPISANSPCKVVPPATPVGRQPRRAAHYCLYPAYRETLPGGPSYTVLDQVDDPRGRRLSAAVKVPPATCS